MEEENHSLEGHGFLEAGGGLGFRLRGGGGGGGERMVYRAHRFLI